MRIIAGKWRRRSIQFPKSKAVRPTQDRVREAVFSKLSGSERDATVLDLCCGSGALGLEALSRGATSVCFVDTHTQTVKANIYNFDCQQHARVVTRHILSFLKTCQASYHLIFLDPPWRNHDLYDRSLKAIYENDILNLNGQLVIEFSRKVSPFSDADFKFRSMVFGARFSNSNVDFSSISTKFVLKIIKNHPNLISL